MLPLQAAYAPLPPRSSSTDMLGDCWAAVKGNGDRAWGGCAGV